MVTSSAAPGALDGDRPLGGTAGPLRAWLYEVAPDGTSRPTWPSTGRPMATVQPDCTLRVSVEGGQNTPVMKFLKAPPAEGMSTDPVTIAVDRNGFWAIQNSGRTNTLRVQQYGLPAVPLHPQCAIPMAGQDFAVWIPVVPRGTASGKSESFRMLIVAAGAQEGAGFRALGAQPVRRAGRAGRSVQGRRLVLAAWRP